MMKQKKVAIVTGAGGGIGSKIVSDLSKDGSYSTIYGIVHSLKNIYKKVSSKKVQYIECDVASEDEIKNVFNEIKSKKIKIDSIINIAGTSKSKKLDSGDSAGFKDDIEVNLYGTFLICLYFQEILKKHGSIVNISSIRARTGTPSGVGYSAAKSGIINLTKSLAIQLANRKIRVNCIAPGAIYPTKMSENWSREKISSIKADVPLGRLGNPSDISNVVQFLISSASSYITGHTIDVNGGEWMNQ